MKTILSTCVGAGLLALASCAMSPRAEVPVLRPADEPAALAEPALAPAPAEPAPRPAPAVGHGPAESGLLGGPSAKPLKPIDPAFQSASEELNVGERPQPKYRQPEQNSILVDRPGRLMRTAAGNGWVFQFRPMPNEKLPLRPMELLPCTLLEEMEKELAAGGPGTVFIINGEVANYRGNRYLLVTKALVELNETTTGPGGR